MLSPLTRKRNHVLVFQVQVHYCEIFEFSLKRRNSEWQMPMEPRIHKSKDKGFQAKS